MKVLPVLWQSRWIVAPVLGLVLAVPIGFVAVVTGVVASMQLTPEVLLPTYMEAAKKSPGEGLQYEQLVAVDAVRFPQDFSCVTPATIQETADFFKHCTVEEDPETGHEVAHCVQRSLDEVMTDLRFTEEDRELVRNMVASLTVRDPGHEGEFVFSLPGPIFSRWMGSTTLPRHWDPGRTR